MIASPSRSSNPPAINKIITAGMPFENGTGMGNSNTHAATRIASACTRTKPRHSVNHPARGFNIFSNTRNTRSDTRNTRPKNPGGSGFTNSFSGSHGFCPNASRSAINAIASPKGVETNGSGIGVLKGSASIMITKVHARPCKAATMSPRVSGPSAKRRAKAPTSSESLGGRGTACAFCFASFNASRARSLNNVRRLVIVRWGVTAGRAAPCYYFRPSS